MERIVALSLILLLCSEHSFACRSSKDSEREPILSQHVSKLLHSALQIQNCKVTQRNSWGKGHYIPFSFALYN